MAAATPPHPPPPPPHIVAQTVPFTIPAGAVHVPLDVKIADFGTGMLASTCASLSARASTDALNVAAVGVVRSESSISGMVGGLCAGSGVYWCNRSPSSLRYPVAGHRRVARGQVAVRLV